MSTDLNIITTIRKPLGYRTPGESRGQRWAKLYNAARKAYCWSSTATNHRQAKRAANHIAKESGKQRAKYGTHTPGGVPIVPTQEAKRIFIRLLTNPANYG